MSVRGGRWDQVDLSDNCEDDVLVLVKCPAFCALPMDESCRFEVMERQVGWSIEQEAYVCTVIGLTWSCPSRKCSDASLMSVTDQPSQQ